MAIENIKHSDYIVELKPGYSLYKAITAPQIGAFGNQDLNGDNFCSGLLIPDQALYHGSRTSQA